MGTSDSTLLIESPARDQLPAAAAVDLTGKHGQKCSKEAYITILAAVGILGHLISRFGWHVSTEFYNAPLLFTLVVGGAPLVFDLFKKMVNLEFGSDLLAGVSIAVALALGEYLAGSIVVLMLSGGTALEHYSMRRASAVLAALAQRVPRIAHRIERSEIRDIDLDQVRIGDRLVVIPHEICPVDGTIVEGRGTMDESYLTGEPFQIAKVPGADVLSGAINGESALTISVAQLPVDSRYAKIMRVMREAEISRPRMKRLADRLGAWYTVVGLSVAAIGWAAGHDSSRFLAVLVIATPCPLLLAVPVAIIAAISVAASRGIIVKNPAMLERVGSCTTVIFDKTGTLTHGRPALTEIICAPGMSRERALGLAASLERYSKHPLAGAILRAAADDVLELAQVSQISEKAGQGLSGQINSSSVQITGRKALLERATIDRSELPATTAGMECILVVDNRYAATFQFHDAPRTESRSFIRHLAPRHRVKKVMLLSGDRESEVKYLAAEVGVGEILSGKNPEEKVEIVSAEARKASTLFVGDGINDAPAMQAATVGVAFGKNSDITAEAADAVVLEPSLSKVDELIHLGRRMRSVSLQSAVGGMGLSILGMLAAAAGYLPPVTGAIAQEVIDVLAVANALRIIWPSDDVSDF
jgi:heavy metal translocating P-type ATPase